MRRVVVTGLGLVTPLGADVETTWKNILAGKSGAGPITHFDASDQKCRIACEVKPADHEYGFDPGKRVDHKVQQRVFELVATGRLVSAAGTHALNAREQIAVVGNVMTHADFRGHDFAKMVTSAVTAELLARVEDVVLNVHADNAPAIAAYDRLGYVTHCQLVERLGRRRSGGWSLM